MPDDHLLDDEDETDSGRFIDANDVLHRLFSHPAEYAERRWKEVFGIEPRKPKGGGAYLRLDR